MAATCGVTWLDSRKAYSSEPWLETMGSEAVLSYQRGLIAQPAVHSLQPYYSLGPWLEDFRDKKLWSLPTSSWNPQAPENKNRSLPTTRWDKSRLQVVAQGCCLSFGENNSLQLKKQMAKLVHSNVLLTEDLRKLNNEQWRRYCTCFYIAKGTRCWTS